MSRWEDTPRGDRRRFLRLVGLGGLATAAGTRGLLGASEEPRAGTGGRPASPVALIATEDRAEGVRRAVALLDPPGLDGRVVIKPNFNSADPAPGSTHPQVLAALVDAVRTRGATSVTVADRSGMGDTAQVFRKLGIDRLAEEMGFDTLVFDDLPAEGWVRHPSAGTHWSRGFCTPKILQEADAVVQACCLKTHRFGGHFTLSLKNAVGIAAKRVPGDGHDYMRELHASRDQRRMIAEVNAAWRPALIVLDGVDAFTHGGPDTGTKVRTGVVLAGRDPVAIDAVGVAILRLHGTTEAVSRGPIWSQEQLARAAELGLGARGPQEVRLLTDDDAGAAYADRVKAALASG